MTHRLGSVLAVVLLLCTPQTRGAEADADLSPPQDPWETWVVGICSFIGVDLSIENTYLTHSIPLLVKEELEPARTHHFDEESSLAYRKLIVERELQQYRASLATLRKQRDDLLFATLRKSEKQERIIAVERKMEQLLRRMAYLSTLSATQIDFSDEKQVAFKEGDLLDPPQFSGLQYAIGQEVDLLIWGRVEEVQGYLYLEVFALERNLQRIVYSYADAALGEELYGSIDEVVYGLSRLILGREWATLVVVPQPEASSVFVDGVFRGSGETRVEFLQPGERLVEIVGPGSVAQQIVNLDPFEVRELQVVLEKRSLGTVIIVSQPAEADVYVDSLWRGRTVLRMERPSEPSNVVLRKDQHEVVSLRIDQTTQDRLDVVLAPYGLSNAEIRKQKRGSFYAAFGTWSLSVPIPLLLYGLSLDIRASWVTNDQPWYDYVFAYAYVGGIVASASLFANTLGKLLDYIDAADS